MKIVQISILLIVVFVVLVVESAENEFEEDLSNAKNFLKRTFFHPGSTQCEEQKREAREDYEERCEPSFPLFRNTGTHRYCPDIHMWIDLDNYEIGDGFNLFDEIQQSSTKKPNYERFRRPTISTTPSYDDAEEETKFD